MRRFLCLGLLLVLCGSAAYAYRADTKSLTYMFAGTTTSYLNNIARTGGNLDYICPDFLEPTAQGALEVQPKASAAFIAAVQAQGIKVLPNVNNHWSREVGRAVIANRVAFAAQAAKLVQEWNLDGIDIDLQNITETDRESFTDLIRLLRQALPADKLLHVCVAANPWGTNKGWQGAYDYAALAGYVDTIFIMTYDESYESGPAGPVASYSFCEKSVKYAVSQAPADKIMLGLPFYGRYWKQGESHGGKALTVNDIENLCTRYDSTLFYDSTAHCARATLRLTEADTAAGLWGGKKLTAGTYDIWYENAESYRQKLTLVDKYGLKGAGSWALGQEPSWVWASYRAWLKGLPFNDIDANWAQKHIISLYDLGIVNGTPNGGYQPERTLSRAEAAVMLCRLLGLKQTHAVSAFADVNGHWAAAWLNTAIGCEILRGSNGYVRPDDNVTRQELAAMLERVLAAPQTVGLDVPAFTDVTLTTPSWARTAIAVLAQESIINGYDDGTFRPTQPITRAEAAKMLAVVNDRPLRTFTFGQLIGVEEIREPIVEPR